MEPVSALIETICGPVLRRGARWQIIGLEHVPEEGPVLLAANHISYLDPPCLAYLGYRRGRRVRFLAMAELFASPVPRVFLRSLGHIPVPRKTAGARQSLTAALTALGWGECLGIFPEGGISKDLNPRAGQTGCARLAGWSGAPVVPVGLWGTHRLAGPGRKIRLRPGVPVVASIGAPLFISDAEDVREATDRIMSAVCDEVARARSAYPPAGPGENGWWVRDSDSARLRSCLSEAVAADPAAPAPLDDGTQLDEFTVAATLVPAQATALVPQESPSDRKSGGDPVLEQQLRTVPFFRNLPAEALRAIASRLRSDHFERGDIVFREGDAGEEMFLVASGQVDVVAGSAEAPLASLGPGSFVGELALLLGEPRSATLRVMADTTLFALSRADLDVLFAEHPAIGIEISRELGRRLVATNRRIVAPPVTRFTGVWGEGVAPLAESLRALPNVGRVGVLVLPGATVSGLPDGVVALGEELADAEALSRMAGREIEGLAHLLIVLPRAETAAGRAAVNLVEIMVVFRPPVGWVVRHGTKQRLLRCDGGDEALARSARWIAGQAVGLALSSGGSKSLAHVGVVRVLRRAGVTIDAVAGTSGGAMAAGGLAFGYSEELMLHHVKELADSLRFHRFDFNLLPRSAIFKGVKLRQALDRWFEGKTFADADIPFWVVATDVTGGAEVVINSGSVADGIRASLSIPGAMNPWPVGGRMCIDGAVVNPMPASVLRDAGLRLVIGSNVAGQEIPQENLSGSPHLLQIMSRMVNSMEREMIKAQIPLVDVLIRPLVGSTSSFDFSRIDEFVAEGERAAEAQLPEIKGALAAAMG